MMAVKEYINPLARYLSLAAYCILVKMYVSIEGRYLTVASS